MPDLPHESRSRQSDDVPCDEHLHDVPHDHRKRSACDYEAGRICKIESAHSLGARLSSDSRRHLDAPRTSTSRHAVHYVPWRRRASRSNGAEHQCHGDGQLHRLSSGAQRSHRLLHLSRLALHLSICRNKANGCRLRTLTLLPRRLARKSLSGATDKFQL